MANYDASDITTDEQAALDQIKEETEAAVKYDIAAKNAKDPVTKEAMEHNKKDELQHAGLMGAVAVKENPEDKDEMMKGVDEMDNFLKKSISQCVRERRERGSTELFAKADTVSSDSGKVNIISSLGGMSLESFIKAYYGMPFDPTFVPGKNRHGYYFLNNDQIEENITGQKPKNDVDLPEYLKNTSDDDLDGDEKDIDEHLKDKAKDKAKAESKDKKDIDAALLKKIYDQSTGTLDENIINLLRNEKVPPEDIRRAILKDAFSNLPQVDDEAAVSDWVDNLDERSAKALLYAMENGSRVGPLSSVLVNPNGISGLSGYYDKGYMSPNDMKSGYEIPEDDEGMAAYLPHSLNVINDLKLRDANLRSIKNALEKEGYGQAFIDAVDNKRKSISSLLGDHSDVQMWDRALKNAGGEFYPQDLFKKIEDQFGADVAKKLASGQYSSKNLRDIKSGDASLYDTMSGIMKPTFESSPLYNALRSGATLDNFMDMYNHIQKYPKAYRAAKGPESKVWDVLSKGGVEYDPEKDKAIQEYVDSSRGPEEEQYLIDALFDGDNSNPLIDDVIDTLSNMTTLEGTPKWSMVDSNARDLSQLYNRDFNRRRNAVEIPQMLSYIARNKVNGIAPDKLEFIKTQLENLQNKQKSELNFKDPDYLKLKDQVFKADEDVSYPDNRIEWERSNWNEDAIKEMDKPQSLAELKERQRYDQDIEVDPELVRKFNENRDELLKEGRKQIDQSTHDPELANNLLKYLKRIDRDGSYYKDAKKNLEALRTGNKGYAMANLLNDPKFTSLISQYAADTVTPEGDLDDNGKKDRETFLSTAGKDAGLLYDPKNAPLRELLDMYGLAFNGQGLSTNDLLERLGFGKDNKGFALDKVLDKDMLAYLVNKNGGSNVTGSLNTVQDIVSALPKTTVNGNEVFKGIDLGFLDDTDPDYAKSREAVQALTGAMSTWNRLKATKDRSGALPDYKQKQLDELEANIPKWFNNLMKGEGEIWSSPLGSYDASSVAWKRGTPDEIYDRFAGSIRSIPTEGQMSRWKWDPTIDISKYNVDFDTTQDINMLRGYNNKKDASNRILQIASAILGPIGAESVPRAYTDKELERFANGEKEYNLPANVLSRVIQSPSSIGRGYGGDAIVWKDLQGEDMDALAEKMENLYSEFIDSGAKPGDSRFVKQIPNVPLEYQGEFDYDKAFDELKSTPPVEIAGDIKDVVSEADAQVGGSPKASKTEAKESKAETVKTPEKQKSAKTMPTAASADIQAVYKSATACTRVRIRSDADDLPDDTGLTMKDIREPTPRNDAEGSKVIQMSTSELMKSRMKRRY